MFRVHSLEDLAPLGNRFRSRVSAPENFFLFIDRKQNRHINNMSIHFGKQSFLSKKCNLQTFIFATANNSKADN